MTQPLVFSDTAQEEWDRIRDADPALASTLDDVFDSIEDGTIRYGQYDNHARFKTVYVPGRSEGYLVVWQPGEGRHELLLIGKL